ncbi:hypothetical protein E6O75_ATG08205 [Venturia nashicola]|uniref:Uncharacterized protein n=1 Tax=Venturia nashicola TaxID=86259 RepID=A0A4Z1P669_9PEZI|nr:hypothetical protein E6O75_ATG08205 [Venturia nashicola]
MQEEQSGKIHKDAVPCPIPDPTLTMRSPTNFLSLPRELRLKILLMTYPVKLRMRFLLMPYPVDGPPKFQLRVQDKCLTKWTNTLIMVGNDAACWWPFKEDLGYLIRRWRIEFFNGWRGHYAKLKALFKGRWNVCCVFRDKLLRLDKLFQTFETELEFWKAIEGSDEYEKAREKERETFTSHCVIE